MESSDSIVYAIDSNYRLVSFNQKVSELISDVKKGDFCYQVFNERQNPCEKCLVNHKDSSCFNVYCKRLNAFFSASHSSLDLPEIGPVSFVSYRQNSNIEKTLMQRMAFLPPCDYFLEINLSQNKYRYLHRDDDSSAVEYNVESFDCLINRLSKTSINPNDVQNFKNFWDLKILPEKMADTTVPLVNTYREKNAVGSWDEVTVTLIPETYIGTEDQIILALYHIKNSTHDVCKLNASEEIDSFTGLYTRRGFVAHAEEYVTDRSGGDLCIIAMDVEHFRLFNKWYGRIEGDKLIKRISVFLLEMDRMFDTVSCYAGGDNF